MKKINLFLLFVVFTSISIFGQNVAINTDGSSPNASAMLDVSSTTKGVLTPRMTAVQRQAISSAATGLLVYQTDGSAGYYYYDGSTWLQISTTATVATPAGVIQQFAATTAPTGYLICDGSAVSRTTYAALFEAIGTTYGSGDGTTTFNLPDLRGKVTVGKSTETEFDAMGETGGAKTHTLTVAQLPSHTHDVNPVAFSTASEGAHTHTVDPPSTTTSTNGSHTHYFVDDGVTGIDRNDSGTANNSPDNSTTTGDNTSAAGDHAHTVDISAFSSGSGGTHSHSIDVPNTTSTSVGSGSAHNNLQPYIVVNYIIKY